MRWDDIDQFGSDCFHLASASGHHATAVILMAYGVSVDRLNTRYLHGNCSEILECTVKPKSYRFNIYPIS